MMKLSACAALVAALFTPILPAGAADKPLYGGVTAVELPMASPSTDVLGRPLAYPAGTPVVKAYRITVPPGAATSVHLHEVPLFAYILSGTLEVDYGTKGKRTYKAGDGFMEAVAWCHRGRAVGDRPAVLVAAYLGNGTLKNAVDCPK